MQLQQKIREAINERGKLVCLITEKNGERSKKEKAADGKAKIIRMRTTPKTSADILWNKCRAFLTHLINLKTNKDVNT